jgi:hypothetical protein
MSTRQVKTCDVCGEEISWLKGAQIIITESTGTTPVVSGGTKFDLCNEHWKPFVAVFIKLGIDSASVQAEQIRKYPARPNQVRTVGG